VSAAGVLPALLLYDLRDPGAWRQVHRDRCLWGRRFTDIHALGDDHVVLMLRSGGERWHDWERVRLKWILAQDPEREAA
jgi:hypothetical protein